MNKRFLGSLLLTSAIVAGGLASEASAAAPGQARSTYIITFKNGSNPRAEADQLRGQGYTVRYVYDTLFPGVAVDLPEVAATNIARSNQVAFMERDFVMSINTTQSGATWGIDRTDQRALPLSGTFTYPDSAGLGVKVFIVDTGVRSTHSEFTGRMASGYNAVGDANGTEDCNGHGTHVAGTVAGTTYGLAKKATVVPVRVLDCSGSGSVSSVAAGLNWVAANRGTAPSVANMSLGGGVSSTIDNAVTQLHNSGVTVVVAAGNSNADACNASPARTPVAITVGATTSTDARASYSNFGTCLDIFAPGSSILSSSISGDTSTATLSGTSMASPHVAGAAALLLGQNSALTPTQVRDTLVSAATSGVVSSAGTGSPNLLLFVEAIGGSTSPTTTTTAPITSTTIVPLPGAFTKSTPRSGSTGVPRTATFTWTASSNATSYQICISTTTTCSSWLNAGSSTSVVVSGLKGLTRYYWQMRAVNSKGTTLASDSAWSFTTSR